MKPCRPNARVRIRTANRSPKVRSPPSGIGFAAGFCELGYANGFLELVGRERALAMPPPAVDESALHERATVRRHAHGWTIRKFVDLRLELPSELFVVDVVGRQDDFVDLVLGIRESRILIAHFQRVVAPLERAREPSATKRTMRRSVRARPRLPLLEFPRIPLPARSRTRNRRGPRRHRFDS